MKRIFSYLFAIITLMGTTGVFTSCQEDAPAINYTINVTVNNDFTEVLNAINNGASGYLLKDIGGNALIDAIKNAHAGDTILPAKIARRIADAARHVAADREIKLMRAFSLSEREVEIALMMYEDFTNRQISAALKLSEGTTRNYVSSIYIKTNSENRTDALQKIRAVLEPTV